MFPRGLRIVAGDAGLPGTVCIALSRPDADEPYSMILIREEGLAQPWGRIDVDRAIVWITSGRYASGAAPVYVALSDEGDVYFLDEEETRDEKIPGAGIFSDDAAGRGAVQRIYAHGDQFTVIGQNGQIYRRLGPGDWRALSESGPPPDAEGDILNATCWLGLSDGTSLVGGFVYPWGGDTTAAEAALEDGDIDSFVDLMFEDERDQFGVLFRVAGAQWTRIDLPTDAVIADLHDPGQGAGVLVAAGIGTALVLREGDEVDFLDGPDTDEDYVSLAAAEGGLLVAAETSIHPCSAARIDAPLRGPDEGFGNILRIQQSDDALWAFDADDLFRLRRGAWERIEVPRAILREG
ncbi:hypothetical protein NHN26_06895 [Rhodovulum tesquicola]|uniref:hypothetical protein n=1 Tax=Rhodovulum tesquicola TaxID=540254 RepID=UPI0020970FEE|nr:hypothetical protein [Rhodovulum tesquicola]MCO8144950.1 hypothetical protein [Rhodovulum tesquicola]